MMSYVIYECIVRTDIPGDDCFVLYVSNLCADQIFFQMITSSGLHRISNERYSGRAADDDDEDEEEEEREKEEAIGEESIASGSDSRFRVISVPPPEEEIEEGELVSEEEEEEEEGQVEEGEDSEQDDEKSRQSESVEKEKEEKAAETPEKPEEVAEVAKKEPEEPKAAPVVSPKKGSSSPRRLSDQKELEKPVSSAVLGKAVLHPPILPAAPVSRLFFRHSDEEDEPEDLGLHVRGPRAPLPPPPPPPSMEPSQKKETPWERGLKLAKEVSCSL